MCMNITIYVVHNYVYNYINNYTLVQIHIGSRVHKAALLLALQDGACPVLYIGYIVYMVYTVYMDYMYIYT